MTPSTTDTQHNNALPNAECQYAGCRVLFTIMLNVVMLNVVMLSVVAPFIQGYKLRQIKVYCVACREQCYKTLYGRNG
jgi:hypothetical protein